MKDNYSNKENVLVLFDCPSCKTRYDNTSRLPIILLCGSTICSKCIYEITRVSISNGSIAGFKSSTKPIPKCPFHPDCNTPLDQSKTINRYLIYTL